MPISVNGQVIDDEAVHEERARLRRRYRDRLEQMNPREADNWLKDLARHNLVSQVLIEQQAWNDPEPLAADDLAAAMNLGPDGRNQGVACSDGAQRATELRLRVTRLLARETRHVPKPTRKEIDLYYKTNRSRFVAPERAHAWHIVKNVETPGERETAMAGIRQAEEELRTGAAFPEVADRYSDCAGNGGELGWFARGAMVDEFEEVVFALTPGETSSVFETRFGFHIARLIEKRPAGILPLSEVRDELAARLYEDRRQNAIAALVDRWAASAEIQFT